MGGFAVNWALVILPECAGMAELVDALDSGSSVRKDVEVQVFLPAPILFSVVD
jgi:hypothetical protein